MNVDYSYEKERKEFLIELMRKSGWEVYQEVVSDQKHENGKYKFRLDIMGRPPNQTFFIGFELKLYDGVRQGGEFFESLKQTLDYQNCTFKGLKIECWVIDLYHYENDSIDSIDIWSNNTYKSSCIFMQSFLQKIGIGMINKSGKINFMISNSEYIHDIKNNPYYPNKTDWNKILDWCKKNKIIIQRERK